MAGELKSIVFFNFNVQLALTYNRECGVVLSWSGGDSIQRETGRAGVLSSMSQGQRYEGDLTSVDTSLTDGPSNGHPGQVCPMTTPINVWYNGDICDCAGDVV